METSFPSKLIEFAQFGKPLVVWGPEYCSAEQWGEQNGLALCVKSYDVYELTKQLEFLCALPKQKYKYAEKSLENAESRFNSNCIQLKLLNILLQVCRTQK